MEEEINETKVLRNGTFFAREKIIQLAHQVYTKIFFYVCAHTRILP